MDELKGSELAIHLIKEAAKEGKVLSINKAAQMAGVSHNAVLNKLEWDRKRKEKGNNGPARSGTRKPGSKGSLYAIRLIDEAKVKGKRLSIRQAAEQAGVSHVAVSRMLKRMGRRE